MDAIEYQKELSREYGGPAPPDVWFMWDNHCFTKITGSPQEMGFQILECMTEDRFCGLLTVKLTPNGQRVDELSFHGDYKEPENTRKRIFKWVEQMTELFPSTK